MLYMISSKCKKIISVFPTYLSLLWMTSEMRSFPALHLKDVGDTGYHTIWSAIRHQEGFSPQLLFLLHFSGAQLDGRQPAGVVETAVSLRGEAGICLSGPRLTFSWWLKILWLDFPSADFLSSKPRKTKEQRAVSLRIPAVFDKLRAVLCVVILHTFRAAP